MGISGSSSSIKTSVESVALPGLAASYTNDHENLIFVPTSESEKVACMLYKIPGCKSIILYSHGNLTDIGRMHKFLSMLSQTLGINIISYDYEGYGLTKGKPSEEGCYRTINAVFNYLMDIGYDAGDVIIYGTSIGTGASVDLAMRVSNNNKRLKGLLLQAPLASATKVIPNEIISSTAETSFDCMNSCIENPNIFRSVGKIGKVTCPITIIHGQKDEVVPFSNAIALQQANKLIELVAIPEAMHNNIERDYFVILKNCLVVLINGPNNS